MRESSADAIPLPSSPLNGEERSSSFSEGSSDSRPSPDGNSRPLERPVPLLSLDSIAKHFATHADFASRIVDRFRGRSASSVVRAVDHVDLTIARGEVVGLVGESGCGKSTLGRIAAGLLQPSSGTRSFEGVPVDEPPATAQRLAVQMVFQDPSASLNPRLRVADLIAEAPIHHKLWPRREARERTVALLAQMGLAADALVRYPHQFSGGQRARIGIARALAVDPRLLVCDEAVASLDVSTQAQVLNLFIDLRERAEGAPGLALLFISHDLAVVRHLADRVAIMYLGRIVEEADAETIYARPNHPYTQALLAETPTLAVGKRRFTAIRGEIPSPLSPPSGCHFHPRCPRAQDVPGDRCRREAPPLKTIGAGHRSACHLNDPSPAFRSDPEA